MEQIAKDFGVSSDSITSRLRRADIGEGAEPGITTVEAVEIWDLERRNRLLEQEVEVMLRTLAYFASREVSSPERATRWSLTSPSIVSPSR